MTAKLTAIDRAEALRYLGCRAAPPPELLDDLSRCESLLFSITKPRAVWRLFDLTPSGGLSGTDYTPGGQDIRAFLSGCDRVILMAATLGAEAEALLRRSQNRSMADAVILDAAASAAIENVCDNLCFDLEQAFFPRFLTGRYSPGYGDLPLLEQEKICRILDLNRRIGVSLTDGGLMIPQKSVTAFIGVSNTPRKPSPQGCEACGHAQNCAFRKDGKSCARE